MGVCAFNNKRAVETNPATKRIATIYICNPVSNFIERATKAPNSPPAPIVWKLIFHQIVTISVIAASVATDEI